MKDLYSFHKDEMDLNEYYEKVKSAYNNIFKKLGLKALYTEASGGTFSKYSHEFQVETENGEDTIFICENCNLAQNKEIYNVGAICTDCGKKDFREAKASEVGNIFKLRTKFSDSLNLNFTDESGQSALAEMGCYGIGTSRIMGIMVELFHDESGIIWPESVAPFKVHLIGLNSDNDEVKQSTEKIYRDMLNNGIDVLYDDRGGKSAGEKFADSDLIGIPNRIIVSARTLKEQSVEFKKRENKDSELVLIDTLKF